ncbi:hypothetical protein ACFW04_002991 [Cataglyphis niger]
MKQTNDLVQDSIKEKNCHNSLVKDISVKLTRLPNKKNKKSITFFNKNIYIKRKKYKLWKYGNIQIYKKKKNSKKSLTQQILDKETSTTEITTKLLESEIDDNTYACLNEQPQKIEEKSCVAAQQNVQNAQENAKDFTLLTCEVQNKKEVSCEYGKTYTCARILPYEFHQKKNKSSNNTTDVVTSYNFLSSSSSSSETMEQNSIIDKICVFNLSKNRRSMKRLVHERLRSKKLATQEELNEWKSKRKRSLSESSEELRSRKKHCRRILSDKSDNNETAVESMEMIGSDNENKSHSYEKINQEKSRPDIQINREVSITLMRLEQMDDVDVIKWRASRIKNALEIIQSQSVKEQQLNKQKQLTLKHQGNETITLNECQRHNLSETQNNHEDLSQFLIVSNTHVEKHCSVRLNDERLNMIKLKKKYKLFKKPRVLIIKLETLKNFSENGVYSAIEIDRLTKKYINFVISSTSSSKSRESLYGFTQRKNMTNMNVIRMEDDKTSYSLSGGQSVNNSSKQLDIDGSSVKDDQVVESNSNKNTNFAFISSQSRYKNLSPKTLRSKNSNLPQKSLLEIWRNAFCTQKSVIKLQKTSAEQSVSAQSTSAEAVSISRNSPKKLADAECKNSVSSSLASTSTSSIKNNTSVKSPGKHALQKKQESVQSTKCNKTSKFELFTSDTNFLSNARVEENIAKNNLLQSKNSTISKSPRKQSAVTEENIIISDSSLNLSKKVLEEMPIKSFEKPSNLHSSTNDPRSMTPIKISKTSGIWSIRLLRKEKFKCIICDMPFENYQSLQKHIAINSCKKVTSPLRYNASKRIGFTENEKIIRDKTCQDRNKSKLSMSQQNSSVDKKSDSRKFNRTRNTAEETTSPSFSSLSSVSEMQNKRLWTPQTKTKPKLIAKSNSDLNLRLQSETKLPEIRHQNSHSVNSDKGKQCKVCLRFFSTYLQLFEHMFKHANRIIKNASIPTKNDISMQKTNENNHRVSDTLKEVEAAAKETRIDVNVQEKGLLENANESNTDRNLVTLEVSQRNAAKKRDETSNLLQAEMMQNLQKEQSITVANDVEHVTDRIRYVEKEKECVTATSSKLQPTKSISICKCHRPKTVNETHHNIQIEIVLLCDPCQTLFRRFECFEAHCQRDIHASCAKNRRRNRTPKLLCVTCQKTLNSIQELHTHLTMHTQLNRKILRLSFLCNICKVIFYSQGPLFNNHFHNHVKNRLFLASRLSFPKFAYVSMKLIETLPVVDNETLSIVNNDKQIEVYIQVADYRCRECNALFILEQDLKSHKELTRCKTDAAAADNGSSGDTNASLIMSKKISILLICGFCNETFYNRAHFELHSLEHKQKRELHSHYTCVSVTAITKVFICKVCTTMWKSLKNFEEHWLTHDTLQEVYICSLCQNHYDTIDLFQEHAITHRNSAEKYHESISCKVIYRDQNFEMNSQQVTINDDHVPCTNSFDGKESSEKIADNNPIQEKQLRAPAQQNLLAKNKQSTRDETIILRELAVSSSKETQAVGNDANVQQESLAQIPSIDVAKSIRATENGDNEKSKDNNDNSENLDDSEEEELTIVMSESEENVMSNVIRKAELKKSNDVSSIKCNNTQGSVTTSDATAFISKEQRQGFNACPTAASVQTLGNANKTLNLIAEVNLTTLNLNAEVSLTGELVTQSEGNANVSQDNESIIERANILNSTATTRLANNLSSENSADNDSMSSSVKSVDEGAKNMLSQNAMSSIPKSFLRVKSLAELTNVSSQNYLCHACGLFFDSLYKLIRHKYMHVAQDEKDEVNSAYTSENSEFNPSMHMTQTQHVSQSSSMITGNTPLFSNAPLPGNAPLFSNALLSGNAPLSGSASSYGNVPPFGNVHPSANVRPLNRTINLSNSRQYQVADAKPLHKITYNTAMNKMVRLNKAPQYNLAWMPSLNNSNVAPQQMMQQKSIYHQNLPPQIAYPINSTIQKGHHNIGTMAVKPFLQTIQVQRPPSPAYPQHQYQQQQQQQQQQQYTSIGNDVRNYPNILPKDSVSYQAPNNVVSANSANVILMNTMLQVSQNPERYICILCPSFECSSVQDFVLHMRSSKHEAHSNYNSSSYVPRA